MATYAFSGRTRTGQTVSGERQADSVDNAMAQLRREQIRVTKIEPVKARAKDEAKPKIARSSGIPTKNLAIFTRQFSVMLDAGLPLVQCLETVSYTHLTLPTNREV